MVENYSNPRKDINILEEVDQRFSKSLKLKRILLFHTIIKLQKSEEIEGFRMQQEKKELATYGVNLNRLLGDLSAETLQTTRE